jgi:hypothetical protein
MLVTEPKNETLLKSKQGEVELLIPKPFHGSWSTSRFSNPLQEFPSILHLLNFAECRGDLLAGLATGVRCTLGI